MSLDVHLENDELNAAMTRLRERIDMATDGVATVSTDDLTTVMTRVDESADDSLYWRNITHNLGKMADAAGIYEHLWRPDEINVTQAAQLIEPLREGLAKLVNDPGKFKALNPSNGWGDYEGLVEFVREYLTACEANPCARVWVSR